MASERYNYVLTESAEADVDEAFDTGRETGRNL